MSELNERISLLVDTLGIKKTAFAEHLNVSQAFISQICSGYKQPSERTVADICREFRVNYLWLTEGKGDMFTSTPKTIVDEIAEDFTLDEIDKKIIEKYLELTDEQRSVIKAWLIENGCDPEEVDDYEYQIKEK